MLDNLSQQNLLPPPPFNRC